MITTALLLVLVIARAVGATAVDDGHRGVLPVVDRLVSPVAVAFVILVLIRVVDLWIRNA